MKLVIGMSKFQLVRSKQKYGGGMPIPWRSGSRSVTPHSAHSPLDDVTWLQVWLGNVVWTCAQEEVEVDFGRLMALSTILSFSVVILFPFQTSELRIHQENECIVSLFPFPFYLFLSLQKIITRIKVNLVLKSFCYCFKNDKSPNTYTGLKIYYISVGNKPFSCEC